LEKEIIQMKNITILQHDYKSLYAVYKITNFLSSDYLEQITNKTIELTNQDSMSKTTGVKANMTKYDELLKHEDYKNLFSSVLEYLTMILRLRSAIGTQKYRHTVFDAWGMQHLKGDYTLNHNHGQSNWSIVYYMRVPTDDTYIHFDEFNRGELIEPNSLFIFPGLLNHSVNKHTSDISRVSISANIMSESI
tara:strand:+ start:603 stop:1178 length:576 start_codon:yes stop_codon:yes gene_type:complete